MYGKNVHRAVLEYGCKVSGVTVHFINEKYDRGAVILQKTINVLDNDTVDSLSSRILAEEHKIYVQAIRLFAEKKLSLWTQGMSATLSALNVQAGASA